MKNIETFLQELNDKTSSDLDLANYYNDGDEFEDYCEAVQQGIYENEIIYYSVAIKYLSENDASLTESLNLAAELSYATENLNSEILATLLYQQNLSEEFYSLQCEIETYFEEYDEYLTNLEEVE